MAKRLRSVESPVPEMIGLSPSLQSGSPSVGIKRPEPAKDGNLTTPCPKQTRYLENNEFQALQVKTVSSRLHMGHVDTGHRLGRRKSEQHLLVKVNALWSLTMGLLVRTTESNTSSRLLSLYLQYRFYLGHCKSLHMTNCRRCDAALKLVAASSWCSFRAFRTSETTTKLYNRRPRQSNVVTCGSRL